jgi:hypothetical protein
LKYALQVLVMHEPREGQLLSMHDQHAGGMVLLLQDGPL